MDRVARKEKTPRKDTFQEERTTERVRIQSKRYKEWVTGKS
jgi:hypothetical protein